MTTTGEIWVTLDRLARARKTGTKSGKPFGRPKVGAAVERKVRELHRQGLGMIKIGKQLGCGTSTVQRILTQHSV